jgi:hypothetical protein
MLEQSFHARDCNPGAAVHVWAVGSGSCEEPELIGRVSCQQLGQDPRQVLALTIGTPTQTAGAIGPVTRFETLQERIRDASRTIPRLRRTAAQSAATRSRTTRRTAR